MLNDILRQNIGDERKLQIVTAALELFLKKGILNVSMNEVIENSGLSKGGVYHHFKNKNEIICAIIQVFCDFKILMMSHFLSSKEQTVKHQMNTLLSEAPEPSQDTSEWRRLGFDFISLAADNPEQKKILSDFYKRLTHIMFLMLKNGQDKGEIKASVDPFQVAMGVVAIFDGQGIAGIFNADSDLDLSYIAKTTVMQLLDGISV